MLNAIEACKSEILGTDPGALPLTDAFTAFSVAAQSLERSYFSLGEEVRRLRQELQQERELRLRREALAEMAAMVAHEVRNPLGSVELFVEMLASSDLCEEKRDWIAQIQRGLSMLSANVNNVLEFHSPSSQRFSRIDLAPLLSSLEKLLRPVAARAGMQLVVDRSKEILIVHADQHRLMQAFLNLSLNAVRFAAGGRLLKVAASREAGTIKIDFEDRGPGVPEELRHKIFEAGFATSSGGLGLGATIARTIIEQHGGTIQVAGEKGGGARFEVRLPRAERER
ncbi:MAG TPA: HAMP domain-containing sensor histidine kinase [Terriglobales bacterium]|jgi:two-component system sensor histidine kinase FlrB